MSEHTKTPWKVGRYGKVQAEGMASWDSINVSGFALCNWEEAEANARHIVHCVNNHERLVDALGKCVAELERNTCLHEETYRAGTIWEICSHCGHKWADDEGGKPEVTENPVVESCRTLLASLEAEKGGK